MSGRLQFIPGPLPAQEAVHFAQASEHLVQTPWRHCFRSRLLFGTARGTEHSNRRKSQLIPGKKYGGSAGAVMNGGPLLPIKPIDEVVVRSVTEKQSTARHQRRCASLPHLFGVFVDPLVHACVEAAPR